MAWQNACFMAMATRQGSVLALAGPLARLGHRMLCRRPAMRPASTPSCGRAVGTARPGPESSRHTGSRSGLGVITQAAPLEAFPALTGACFLPAQHTPGLLSSSGDRPAPCGRRGGRGCVAFGGDVFLVCRVPYVFVLLLRRQ